MVASIRYMPALAQFAGPAASPTSTRSTLGCPSGSAAPAPVPTASTVQAGAAPQAVAIVVSSAAPVGVHSSIAAGCALSGAAASASIRSTAGTGTGTVPWAVLTDPEPAATGDTTRVHGSQQAEGMQRERTPGHVGDGVERPDLVEADLVGGDAVDVGLRAGQPAEDGDREVPHLAGQAGPGQDRDDVGQVARGLAVGGVHHDLGRP